MTSVWFRKFTQFFFNVFSIINLYRCLVSATIAKYDLRLDRRRQREHNFNYIAEVNNYINVVKS